VKGVSLGHVGRNSNLKDLKVRRDHARPREMSLPRPERIY